MEGKGNPHTGSGGTDVRKTTRRPGINEVKLYLASHVQRSSGYRQMQEQKRQHRNLDPISERRVGYKQSLLNQAGSVRAGQKLPAERAFLEGGIPWS